MVLSRVLRETEHICVPFYFFLSVFKHLEMGFLYLLTDPVYMVAVVVVVLAFLYSLTWKRYINLPPGPKPWPVVGKTQSA